ncbi:YibE/F family protein [Patescibacteria group bacterium]|nr:YibE/F family protein [Patescibacteria group bacterium]MBU4347456.1 YibE/F family protein [Patescibacteria group bacterium]MBU4455340.1 YibE/F family protein [Patescibacteria group bacterium]MCG2690605.1 YibE/F family protein [Candidatus Parcubacteria bacterium]
MNYKKLIILPLFLLIPVFVFAQADSAPKDAFFKAEVIEITEQKTTILPDGAETEQQNLILRGLEGAFKDKEINFNGIGEIDVINKNIYRVGDRVLAVASFDAEGNAAYYITDYVRTKGLWWLAIAFALTLIVVGRGKGARSLLALALTFLVIIKYIIPQILAGTSPLIITLIGSIIILLIIIYATEGFCARSHIAFISILFSLIIAILLSWFFVSLTKLTGVTSEEASFLLYIGEQAVNFKGLLLAGIIIGALGVLDDVVISQVAAVEQIAIANSGFRSKELFKRAYKVGVSHIASMTNTLFLAYAGVSLPLLIVFISGTSAFSSWGQVVNNEQIATEIVRTLAGSIGLILSVPIATFIAAWRYGAKE